MKTHHQSNSALAAVAKGMAGLARRALVPALALTLSATGLHAATYTFSTLAGAGATLDHTDGSGTNARFLNPVGMAIDGSGNIYVADSGDHTIRKVTPGGTVTTFAGSSGLAGSVNGTGTGARFVYPFAVAVDTAGNVYVADNGDHTIRKITAGGAVSLLAGSANVTGAVDALGNAATFNDPQGIAVDTAGNVYVCDTNNSTIRKITPTGSVSTLAGAAGQFGTADGTGSGARFNYPSGITFNPADGALYVADFGNSSIRKVTLSGTVTTFAGSSGNAGHVDATGTGARFDHPNAVSADAAGAIYVVDTSNQTVRQITPGGVVTTLAGESGVGGSSDGSGVNAHFFYPFGIVAAGGGTLYVADTGNHKIRTVTTGGSVSTLAGAVGTLGSIDGSGTGARFAYPYGVAVDNSGNVYVADHNNHTIRKITSGGSVTTLAGVAGVYGAADGAGGAARFSGPTGVAVDGNGNIYVADSGNNTIRKITAAGVVSTFAGSNGAAGSADGTGSSARFNNPQGVSVDGFGNVYVADTNNDTIRKITPAGVVTTIAGSAGAAGNTDSTAGAAVRFNGPYAISVTGDGQTIYVADFFNNTIRRMDSSGSTTTLAGLAGKSGYVDANGTNVRFNQVYGLVADANGHIFIADTGNRSIRILDNSGIATTISGSTAHFYYPQGIAVDTNGNLYVADGDNQTVMKGSLTVPPIIGGVSDQAITVGGNATFSLSNPVSGQTYQWQLSTDSGATWANVANNSTYSGATASSLTVTNAQVTMNGTKYRVQVTNDAGTVTSAVGTLSVATTTGPGDPTSRLINLSVLHDASSGLTMGFVIRGSGAKKMVLRGVGPTLSTGFGVGGAMPDPRLELFGGSTSLGVNEDWGGTSALRADFVAVGAFSLPDTSKDAAMTRSLASGDYSAKVTGSNGSTGVALIEAYDEDPAGNGMTLVNLSALTNVNANSSLTAGFVIRDGKKKLLIRAVGPGLAGVGVGGYLNDPHLTLYKGSTAIQTNEDWGGTAELKAAFTATGAFNIPDASKDAAMLVTLDPGDYSVTVTASGSDNGSAIVEIYNDPN